MLSFTSSLSPDSDAFAIFVWKIESLNRKRSCPTSDALIDKSYGGRVPLWPSIFNFLDNAILLAVPQVPVEPYQRAREGCCKIRPTKVTKNRYGVDFRYM